MTLHRLLQPGGLETRHRGARGCVRTGKSPREWGRTARARESRTDLPIPMGTRRWGPGDGHRKSRREIEKVPTPRNDLAGSLITFQKWAATPRRDWTRERPAPPGTHPRGSRAARQRIDVGMDLHLPKRGHRPQPPTPNRTGAAPEKRPQNRISSAKTSPRTKRQGRETGPQKPSWNSKDPPRPWG